MSMDKVKRLGWIIKDGDAYKQYNLESFKDAVDFLNDIAYIIDSKKMYPIIIIDANNVTISIKDIQDKHVALVEAFNKAYEAYKVDIDDHESRLLLDMEDKHKAKHRTRGPYRKSSSAGLV